MSLNLNNLNTSRVTVGEETLENSLTLQVQFEDKTTATTKINGLTADNLVDVQQNTKNFNDVLNRNDTDTAVTRSAIKSSFVSETAAPIEGIVNAQIVSTAEKVIYIGN